MLFHRLHLSNTEIPCHHIISGRDGEVARKDDEAEDQAGEGLVWEDCWGWTLV